MPAAGSVDAGAETAGSQAGGVKIGNGAAETDDSARIRQEQFSLGFAKASEKHERESAGRLAAERAKWLTDLGFASEDEAAQFREQRAVAVKAKPEHERKIAELTRHNTESQKRVTELEEAHRDALDKWFDEFRGRLAQSVARVANLHDYAEEDLDAFLDRNTVTRDDGELVLRDGNVEIELDDPEAVKKLAAHVAKRREFWIRPTLATGAGTATVRGAASDGKPLTPTEARHRFIEQTIADMPLARRQ